MSNLLYTDITNMQLFFAQKKKQMFETLQFCNIPTLPINPIVKLGNTKYYICMQGGNTNEK